MVEVFRVNPFPGRNNVHRDGILPVNPWRIIILAKGPHRSRHGANSSARLHPHRRRPRKHRPPGLKANLSCTTHRSGEKAERVTNAQASLSWGCAPLTPHRHEGRALALAVQRGRQCAASAVAFDAEHRLVRGRPMSLSQLLRDCLRRHFAYPGRHLTPSGLRQIAVSANLTRAQILGSPGLQSDEQSHLTGSGNRLNSRTIPGFGAV